MSLVDLQLAIEQLRESTGQNDAEIANKLDEAEAWAREVIGRNFDETWSQETLPRDVRSAILARLQALYDGSRDYFDLADRLIERRKDRTVA